MKKLAEFIIQKNVPIGEDATSIEHRSKIGNVQGWISVWGNAILFILKFVLGMFSGSIALLADAFHTLSDVITSGIVIFGFHIAKKPADKEHPFGHGRAETIATLTIALLLGFVGFEFLKTGIHRILNPSEIQANWYLVSAVVLTILVKEWMAKLAYHLGDIIDSDTLRADALHHRSDSLSSVLVVISLISVRFGYTLVDGLMAIGVAGFMLYSGYSIARNAIDDLLGSPVSNDTIEDIRQMAKSVDKVYNVHDIIVHRYGMHNFISMHIEVDEKLSAFNLHNIADKVEKIVAHKLTADVVTHVDPVIIEGETVENIRQIVQNEMKTYSVPGIIQDLRFVEDKEVESILFQVPVPVNFPDVVILEENIRQKLTREYPSSAIMMDFVTQLT
ncbi:MAG: cation transporter [Candidatus Marinimicrobia bacterium]|nr:cation transporter [Candidatus Neomarinimicrobiota bacterium]